MLQVLNERNANKIYCNCDCYLHLCIDDNADVLPWALNIKAFIIIRFNKSQQHKRNQLKVISCFFVFLQLNKTHFVTSLGLDETWKKTAVFEIL